MTGYLQNKLLDAVFSGVAFMPPTRLQVGAFSGKEEIGSPGYRRQTALFKRVDGVVRNQSEIMFSVAEEDWERVTHFGIFDASQMMFYAPLVDKAGRPKPRMVTEGDQLMFRPGQLTVGFKED